MSYLVRKINKRKNLDYLKCVTDMCDVNADMPTGEFKTTNQNLSTWHINSLEELNDAVLAIAITSSEITRMDFIVINTDILDENKLQYDQTYAGMKIAVPDLQDTHYDIQEISLKKLENCCEVYKKILQDDDEKEIYIVRYASGQIKDLIKAAIKANRVDINKAKGKIKETMLQMESSTL